MKKSPADIYSMFSYRTCGHWFEMEEVSSPSFIWRQLPDNTQLAPAYGVMIIKLEEGVIWYYYGNVVRATCDFVDILGHDNVKRREYFEDCRIRRMSTGDMSLAELFERLRRGKKELVAAETGSTETKG